MALPIIIFLLIIVQFALTRVNRFAGSLFSIFLTTGILLYGLYLYGNTGHVLTWRGVNLTRNTFLILVCIWYAFDLFFLAATLLPRKREGNTARTDEAPIPIDNFLGMVDGTIYWPRAGNIFLALFAAMLIPRILLSLFSQTINITRGEGLSAIIIPALFLIAILSTFKLLRQQSRLKQIAVLSAGFGLLTFLYNLLFLLFTHNPVRLSYLFNQLIGETVYAALLMTLLIVCLRKWANSWLAALFASFCANMTAVMLNMLIIGINIGALRYLLSMESILYYFAGAVAHGLIFATVLLFVKPRLTCRSNCCDSATQPNNA